MKRGLMVLCLVAAGCAGSPSTEVSPAAQSSFPPVDLTMSRVDIAAFTDCRTLNHIQLSFEDAHDRTWAEYQAATDPDERSRIQNLSLDQQNKAGLAQTRQIELGC